MFDSMEIAWFRRISSSSAQRRVNTRAHRLGSAHPPFFISRCQPDSQQLSAPYRNPDRHHPVASMQLDVDESHFPHNGGAVMDLPQPPTGPCKGDVRVDTFRHLGFEHGGDLASLTCTFSHGAESHCYLRFLVSRVSSGPQ